DQRGIDVYSVWDRLHLLEDLIRILFEHLQIGTRNQILNIRVSNAAACKCGNGLHGDATLFWMEFALGKQLPDIGHHVLLRLWTIVNVGEFYIDRAGVYDLLLSAADGR